ncbi:MAG: NUDIX hydrolase [Anaerolineae bacterium]|nr:NUDIX hydrolase [Anaerolineae bacterium]MCX8068705.1 NUDIX hydrolase [Anaerolineae bacterium]MDW7991226.1 NUDIX hydrolase [Anaerolineae bacterium]
MSIKRLLAHVLHAFPRLYPLMVRLIQTRAARFTVGVTGVVFNARGEILLLEHVFRTAHPWGLPGGWVERGERPQEALRRELREEMGLKVRVGPPVLVDLGVVPDHLETVFLCEIEGEMGSLSGEILAARWVFPDALPEGLKPLDYEAIRRAVALRAGK